MAEAAIVLPLEIAIVLSVQSELGVVDDTNMIFKAAFDWYYVPRSVERAAYAARVVGATVSDFHNGGPLPDWFIRVYELRCLKLQSAEASILPPPDPASKNETHRR